MGEGKKNQSFENWFSSVLQRLTFAKSGKEWQRKRGMMMMRCTQYGAPGRGYVITTLVPCAQEEPSLKFAVKLAPCTARDWSELHFAGGGKKVQHCLLALLMRSLKAQMCNFFFPNNKCFY